MSTRPEYAAVKAAYLLGGRDNSLPKLAAKFGIPLSTLEKRAAAEKWKRQREEAGAIASVKTVEQVAQLIADEATAWVVEGVRLARQVREEVFERRHGVQTKVTGTADGPVTTDIPFLNDPKDLRAFVSALLEVDRLGRIALRLDEKPAAAEPGTGRAAGEAAEHPEDIARAILASLLGEDEGQAAEAGDDAEDVARAIIASLGDDEAEG